MTFIKQVLATMVGISIMGVLASVIFFASIVSMLASSDSGKTVVRDGAVLEIDLEGVMSDRTMEAPLDYLIGGADVSVSLADVLAAIREAKSNDKIDAVLIHAGVMRADVASLQEIHEALENLRSSGKKIFAYGDNYSQGAYYVCTAADVIMLNPSGIIDWHGMASQPIFYKEMLDKLGVEMQLVRVGKYKSYGESFTRSSMSDENREQIQTLLKGMWGEITAKVSARRKISIDSLNSLADNYVAFGSPEQFVKSGLADTLCYIDGAKERIVRELDKDRLDIIYVKGLASAAAPKYDKGKVAVYFAEGSIVSDEVSDISGGSYISSERMVPDLEELADDDEVKAVVLRINSPGGSAAASEMIWHAVRELAAKKPVVVSMGGAAASGGYYISSAAKTIYADPTTITGSIGIFAMVPNASGLLSGKIGLRFETVKTNKSGDFLSSMSRQLTEGEASVLQAYIDRGYDLFLSRVSEGRNMPKEKVHEIAQGRVWTGADAKRLGLVDKLGGLDNAVAHAAKLAGVDAEAVAVYPMEKPWYESLLDDTKKSYFDEQMDEVLGELYSPIMYTRTLRGKDCVQMALPYRLIIK